MRQAKRRELRLESLEPRLPLAGLVTAVTVDGDLVVTGDTEYNEIEILAHVDAAGAVVPGAFDIVGTEGTSINAAGQESALVEGVTDGMLIDMPAGYDVRFREFDGERVLVQGDVRATLDPGDEDSYLRMGSTDVGGNVFIETAPGSSSVTLSNMEVTGSVDVKVNAGYNSVKLLFSQVGGDFDVAGGQGSYPVPKKITEDNRTELYLAEVGGNVTIEGLPSHKNWFWVERGEVDGDVSFVGGPGQDLMRLARCDVGKVTVATGDSFDRLGVIATTVDEIFAQMGAGPDLAELLDTTAENQVVVYTGGGHDLVGVLGLTTSGLGLRTGQARDIVFIGTNASWVPPSPVFRAMNNWRLPVAGMGLKADTINVFTGAGNDWVEMQKSNITHGFQLDTGAGKDRVRLDRAQVDALDVDLGGGSDVMDLIACEISSNWRFEAGGGRDKLRAIRNEITGDATISMGSGNDVLVANRNDFSGKTSLSGDGGFDCLVERKNVFGVLWVANFEKIK